MKFVRIIKSSETDDEKFKNKLKYDLDHHGIISRLMGEVDDDVHALTSLVFHSNKFEFYNQIKEINKLYTQEYAFFTDAKVINNFIDTANIELPFSDKFDMLDIYNSINDISSYIEYVEIILNSFKQDMDNLIMYFDSFYPEIHSSFGDSALTELINLKDNYIKMVENYIRGLEKENSPFDKFLMKLHDKYGSGYIARDDYEYAHVFKNKPYYNVRVDGWTGDGEEYYRPGYWDGNRLDNTDYGSELNKAYKEQDGEPAPSGKGAWWSF